MPSPFDISVATNTVKLDNKREGVATFTVKNNTRRRLHGTAKLSTQPPTAESWLSIVPPEGAAADTANVRDFPIDGTQQYQVKIAVPLDAAPAAYTMHLTVSDEINPDDNFTVSPDVMFTVPEVPKLEPRPFPTWIIPAIIIAVLVIIAIIAGVVISSNNQANANATNTAVALENARNIADTATATTIAATSTTAANLTATQQAIDATATQQAANAAATQTTLNVFVGSWLPVTGSSGPIEGLGISSTGNNQVTITYSGRCPPDQNLCFASSRTFTFTNVPFNPSQLAAGGSALQMLIVPANNGQLLITVQQGSFSTLQQFRRRVGRDILTFEAPFMIATSVLSQFQLDQMRLVMTQSP